MTDQEPLQLHALEEAARRLGIHRRSIERLIEQGELPVVQIGRRKLIHDADLRTFVESRRQPH